MLKSKYLCKLYLLSLALVISTTVLADSKCSINSNDIIAMCGDSLTEQKLYTTFIETYLAVCQAGGPVHTAQFGWGGDSMRYLWSRGGPKPVLSIKPTVVTTLFGMNDGWYQPLCKESESFYRDGMIRLVNELKSNGVRLVIIGSPSAVDTETFRNDPDKAKMYNHTLSQLGDIAKQVAADNGCRFANVHDVMIDVMAKAKKKYGAKYLVAGSDGVHPGANGHLVIAYVFLKAMGCDGDIGTITHDLKSGVSTVTDGHKVVSNSTGTITIESLRYPFCFSGKPDDPSATAGIIEFFPFNKDLNRLMLKVTGVSEKSDTPVRVFWGNTSKVFSSGTLEKGINLAEEFTNNPFCEKFTKIQTEVLKKQTWETVFYKSYLSDIPAIQKDIIDVNPELSKKIDRLEPALVKRQAQYAKALAADIVPVIHTLRFEVEK